jgi:hypothetical protein
LELDVVEIKRKKAPMRLTSMAFSSNKHKCKSWRTTTAMMWFQTKIYVCQEFWVLFKT